MMFTTASQDNDQWSDGNCAVRWAAPWWYYKCGDVILTGAYGSFPGIARSFGIHWEGAWGFESFAKYATMMVRPI
jgi:hypothetical protein